MTEKHLTESYMSEEICTNKKQRSAKLFQTVTLVFLTLFWGGYFYSLYRGNESNISWYIGLILIFSLLNQDVLFQGEKIENKVLNILAKLEGILFVGGVIVAIVHLILK